MSDGWAVVVTLPSPAGQVPTRHLYLARTATEGEAEEKVTALCGSGKRIMIVQPIGAQIFETIGVKAGGVSLWQTI